MDPFEMVVAIVSIGCGTGIIHKALDVLGSRRKSASTRQSVETELAALRREIADLKTWASGIILSFDSTLQQQDARLQSVERRALGVETDTRRRGELPAEQEALEVRARM